MAFSIPIYLLHFILPSTDFLYAAAPLRKYQLFRYLLPNAAFDQFSILTKDISTLSRTFLFLISHKRRVSPVDMTTISMKSAEYRARSAKIWYAAGGKSEDKSLETEDK